LILADTSAWVEFLRGTGSEVSGRFRELLRTEQLATTDAVFMEVLVGARDNAHRKHLRRLLGTCDFIATEGPRDYENAAEVSRACRQAKDRVPGVIDCLIATVAIRAEVPVLASDSDFAVIARHTRLELTP
jgi:predicted nucleic acid-binding protein